jgi:glutathione S-transferase
VRRLVTIGISHYCEKARWALDRAGLPFEEEARAPGLHAPLVWRVAGQRSTPVLVDGARVVADSTLILDHVQAHPDARWRPWPSGAAGEEARALEARFDDEVGPHVRRFAYHHLLPDRAATLRAVGSRTPAGQTRAFGILYPLLSRLIRRGLRIDDAGAARSLAKLEGVTAFVESRLADGRRYLVGDTFTGADLTFAALAGVMIMHPTYLPLPPEVLPPTLRDWVLRARERPAGQFAWRMFEAERGLNAR